MEINWYGHSCFRLTERRMASIVTDPFDHKVVGYEPLKLRADVVTISHQAPGHDYISAVKTRPRVIHGPGEFEIGHVFITSVRSAHQKSRGNGDEKRNIFYVFDYDGVTVAHLGDLSWVPDQKEIEALGNVNVALIPVGGGGGLNAAKAAEVVSMLEPGIVVPMHYDTPDCKLQLDPLSKFLKEMGLGEVDPVESLKVSATTVPDETNVVVLDYKH
jgi:L-ascorbate metabolism protein UlaG (beta-lactamase superfamily)